MARRRQATRAVSLGITAIMAAALSGCAASTTEVDADYAKVCRDQATQERVDDDQCNTRSSPSVGWYFLALSGGRAIPRVGATVSGGTASLPSGAKAQTVSTKGGDFGKSGTVSRGGFGSKGGGAGS
jgi:hypothetical protein